MTKYAWVNHTMSINEASPVFVDPYDTPPADQTSHTKLPTGALKDNKGKVRMDLVPAEAVIALGEVYTYGATKYEPHNWRKGIPFSETIAATERHWYAWKSGKEDIDPESKLHHLKHHLTDVAMLIYQIENGRDDLDDRYTKPEKL